MEHTFEVYQYPNPIFREIIMSRGPKLVEQALLYREMYEHVATVKCGEMSQVFDLTNTINSYWWENEEVVPRFTTDGCRSTSVGDIIKTTDGSEYIVDSIGFKKIK